MMDLFFLFLFFIIVFVFVTLLQSKKGSAKQKDEEKIVKPTVSSVGEHVFGVAHIYASFNDTFVVLVLL